MRINSKTETRELGAGQMEGWMRKRRWMKGSRVKGRLTAGAKWSLWIKRQMLKAYIQ